MEEAGDNEMAVVRGLDPLQERAATKNIATDDRHQQRMLEVVVKRVAAADTLDSDARERAQPLRRLVVGRAENLPEIVG